MPSSPTSNSPISSFKSPFPPLPTPLITSPQQRWEKFTDDIDADHDAPSLSDLPPNLQHHPERKPSDAFQDFEFLTCDNGRFLHVGHQGQLLPPPPPPSSNCTSTSGTTSNSNCSSASVSRSQSSSSNHSSNSVLPRLSVSNRFYAHPSPKPQVRSSVVSGRKSTGSAPRGWGLFRVGVVKVPEIELNNLRSRLVKSNDKKCVVPKEKSRFGFGCKCDSDVLDPVMIPTSRLKKERKSDKSRRVFEWLEEASIGNGPNNGKFV